MTNKWWIAFSTAAAVLIVAVTFALVKVRAPQMKSFPLRYLSGTEAAEVLSGHLPPGAVEGWSEHGVFVRGNADQLATVSTILGREDQPKPQVTLRFQIIEADGFTTSDPAIATVEKELRSLFKFRGYRLAAEAYLQSRAESGASQTVTGPGGDVYELGVDVGDVVRRRDKASAELEVQLTTRGSRVLGTSVSVPDGQTIVLGTARPNPEHAALILVVTPTIK